MIYQAPAPDDPIDQGDLIIDCPVAVVTALGTDAASSAVAVSPARVIVVTQTCDLANDKAQHANVAVVFDAQFLVDAGVFKPADIRGQLRSGRIWGWYCLPSDAGL